MQSLELQPTPENILDTYLNDSIGRNSSIHDFVTVLNSIEGHYSIALEGGWGSGKTFFVKQIMQVLQAQNQFSNCEKKQEILSKIPNSIKAVEVNPQFCVYYDSWTNDNHEDPLLSLIYEILKTTNSSYSFKKARINASQIFKGIANIFSNAIIKTDISSVLNGFEESEDIFKELKTEEDLRKSINDFFDSLLVEQGERLVIFIDELDRCKPTFAVKLLERIKHYFMHDRITFVFSVNLTELQHTICQLYGTNFSGTQYLNRFFDIKITLPEADIQKYCSILNFNDDTTFVKNVAHAFINYYKLKLREIAKYIQLLNFVHKQYIRILEEDYQFRENFQNCYAIYMISTIIVGLKVNDSMLFEEFINGSNPRPLIDVMLHGKDSRFLCTHLLLNETQSDDYANELQIFYDELFLSNLKTKGEEKAGERYKAEREFLHKIATLL